MRGHPVIFDGYGRPAVRGYWGSGYRGAEFSKSRGIMPGMVADSRDEITNWTRSELLRKSRYLKKNVGMIRGVAKALVDHAVGPGIFAIPNTSSDDFNAAAFDYFQQVAEIGDVSGRLTFWELQAERVKGKFFDGDGFLILTRSAHGWPQWQWIRGHNCGNFDVDERGARWRDGVRVDSVGRARAYRFRLDGGRHRTVDASHVVHSYMVEDSDQVRGVTALAHAINDLHDAMEAMQIEHEAIKDNSRVGRVIKTESGDDEEEDNYMLPEKSSDAASAGTLPLEKIFGAEIVRLRENESLESFVSNRPSPTFMGWIDYIGRSVTVGCGFPYEWAWDPKGITGPAQRAVLEKVKTSSESWRMNEIADSRPFYVYSIAVGIQEGLIGAEAPLDWWEHEWFSGARDVTIDRGRDGREMRESVLGGFTTLKEYHAAKGRWWQHEEEQRADEIIYRRQVAERKGLDPSQLDPGRASSAGGAASERPDDDEADGSENQQRRQGQ